MASHVQRLAAAVEALTTRAGLPTRLEVRCEATDVREPLLQVTTQLQAAGAGVTELVLSRSQGVHLSSQVVTAFLAAAAVSFPNIHTLTLDYWAELPAPPAWRQLKHLTVKEGPSANAALVQRVYSSIARYLPQLESLRVDDNSQDGLWHLLLTPATATTTLKSLSTQWALTAPAVRLLVAHAPALQRLTVAWLELRDQDLSGHTWGVECVDVLEPDVEEEEWDGLRLQDVALLPRRSQGRCVLVYEGILYLNIERAEQWGLSASVQACLPHWTFHIPDVLIRPVPRKLEAPMLPWADEGAALAPVLRDVITRVHMEATGRNNDPCVILKGWHWNPDMAVVVAQALPAPGPGVRTFEIDTKALTDDVLGGVLCLGAHVNKVHAKTFKLLTDQHANAPWPWQHLVINDRVTLPVLMGLPRPAEGQRPHLRVHELVLQYDIAEVGVEAMRAWLQGVRLVTETASLVANDSVTLQQHITVLRAMFTEQEITEGRFTGLKVWLKGWSLDVQHMVALRQLPPGLSLNMTECSWSLQPAAYTALAEHIPRSYEILRVPESAARVGPAIQERRQALGLPALSVHHGAPRFLDRDYVLESDLEESESESESEDWADFEVDGWGM